MAEEHLPGANEQPVEQPTGSNLQPTENENVSEENIQHPTFNTQHNEGNMEVHKHPHHVTHKKKWNEYLLEFLMLFLAVFLGFVAENWREHSVENNREKQFIKSLENDIKADTARIKNIINLRTIRERRLDSLTLLLNNDSNVVHTNIIYFYAGTASRLS